MAVRFNANTANYLNLAAADSINYNADYTLMGWFYVYTLQPGTGTVNALFQLVVDDLNRDRMSIDSATAQPVVSVRVAGGTVTSARGTAVSTAAWHHWALVRSGTTLSIYIDGSFSVSVTLSLTGRSSGNQILFGHLFGGNDSPDADMCYLKAWQVALSAGEVAAEVNYMTPQKAGYQGFWYIDPGATRLNDTSGNGHTLVLNGTLADDTNQILTNAGNTSVTQGANTLSATANNQVTANASMTQDANTLSSTATSGTAVGTSFPGYPIRFTVRRMLPRPRIQPEPEPEKPIVIKRTYKPKPKPPKTMTLSTAPLESSIVVEQVVPPSIKLSIEVDDSTENKMFAVLNERMLAYEITKILARLYGNTEGR